MAGEVSPVHLPRSLSSGSRFLLVAGQCEMIVSCLSSYSSFDFFNGVCCRQVKPLRTSLLLFSTTLITIPNDDQWQAILCVTGLEPIRNRMMLALAYDAGLRREERCAMRTDDLDPAHRTLRIRAETTKGRRERIVAYSASTSILLQHYLGHRQTVSRARGPLFLSESDRNFSQPITIWTWSKVVKRIADLASVPQFSTHTLRHLCLTDLARSGWELHAIATFAGHRNLSTTLQYIHRSGRDLSDKLGRSMAQIHSWRAQLLAEGTASKGDTP